MARPDHWTKNVFVLLGALLALFYRPGDVTWAGLLAVAVAVAATCLVASSNYVLNEVLDAPYDRHHPEKRHRPAARGLIDRRTAYLLWYGLGVSGVALAATVHRNVAIGAGLLWFMGLVYNVHPLRTKDHPHVDVLTEALNNPIRLAIGWFALIPLVLPPLSLAIAYWTGGAFLMAAKRLVEYGRFRSRDQAIRYRRSFRGWDRGRLLAAMTFHATTTTLFLGIFLVRYKLELLLIAPLVASFAARYTRLALRPDSPADRPELLFRERGIMVHALVTVALFAVLMFVEIPSLYEIFNVEPASGDPLWRLASKP